MNEILEGGEHLERGLAPEPLAKPVAGSIVLHLVLAGLVGYYAWILGIFQHNYWGNQGLGGAMQVNLISSTLPLPATQINQNVLATETPSQAPAAPSPKEQKQVDQTAIPILGKRVRPHKETTHKTQPHQQPQRPDRADYGEQAGSSMPRATSPVLASNGPVNVGDNNFASLFGWYVDQINRVMANNWYKQEVDPRTPHGSRVYLVFTINRDGSPGNLRLDRSSGSPTLDQSCLRAVQRVETFGPLPAAYNQSTLKVSYYCEY